MHVCFNDAFKPDIYMAYRKDIRKLKTYAWLNKVYFHLFNFHGQTIM